MTETPVPSESAAPATELVVPATEPVVPEPRAAKSRGWIGVLVGFVVLGLLVGVNAVLFTRVQDAQDRADEAVTLAGGQDEIEAQLQDLDARLASAESSDVATADDVDAVRAQVAALRKCVNTALDSFAQATQSGKPVSITKC
jgi:hypothetical protein